VVGAAWRVIDAASERASSRIRSASLRACSFSVDGSLLGGHERRAQEPLDLAVADQVALELLDLVGEVGALAPHVLEARDDLVEQRVDRSLS
jgi:hypothetical protein